MDYTKEEILEKLKKIRHAEKGEDIVALGLIKDILISDSGIKVLLFFNTPNDPFKKSIKDTCLRILESELDKNIKVEVEMSENTKDIEENNSEFYHGIKNIIAIASGKGGVGKSSVASNIAVSLAKKGYKVGLLDADIFGPSIPKMFGIENERPEVIKKEDKDKIVPIKKYGVDILSIGFFVKQEDAVVWRGPMASNALKQLMQDGEWEGTDYLLVDLPPGTSDIHLTLVQTVPVTGAVIISTPQKVALADAIKGINMFTGEKVNVPVLGLVENMSWFTPDELPNNKYFIFGEGGCEKLAKSMNLPLLGQIPIVQSICEDGDSGKPSAINDNLVIANAFEKLTENLIKYVDLRNKEISPTKKVFINYKNIKSK